MKIFLIIWLCLVIVKVTKSDDIRLREGKITRSHWWIYLLFNFVGGCLMLNNIL